MTSGYHTRLANLIKESGLTNYKIAKILEISPSTVANYLKGTRKPDSTKLKALCELLQVNIQWLLTGDGPKKMLVGETPPTYSFPGKKKSDSNEDMTKKVLFWLQHIEDQLKEMQNSTLEMQKTIALMNQKIEKIEKQTK